MKIKILIVALLITIVASYGFLFDDKCANLNEHCNPVTRCCGGLSCDSSVCKHNCSGYNGDCSGRRPCCDGYWCDQEYGLCY